jgi:hypothetical protein
MQERHVYFTGANNSINGDLASLNLYNLDVQGTITNSKQDLIVSNNLIGTGNLIQDVNSKLTIVDDTLPSLTLMHQQLEIQ